MDAFSVVADDPGRKRVGSFNVAGEGLPVGPLDAEGSVDAFDFAVLAGAVALDELLHRAEFYDRGFERGRFSPGQRVVADHAFDAGDAEAGEVGRGADQESCRGGTFLIGVDLGVGEAGVIVDGSVDVIEPDPATPEALASAMGTPPTTVRDAAEFLHIDVDQLAGSLAFVAVHRCSARANERPGDRI